MEAIIHQILLFLLLIDFPVRIQAKNHCPASTCNSTFFPVRYPFKLKTDIPPKNCQDYINLTCNNQGQALINIPASGDFIVNYVDYYTGSIALTDPGNCLPGRMMRDFAFYPLQAFHYDNYTYYSCPRQRLGFQFTPIDCLSSTNAENATIVTRFSAGYMKQYYDCEMILTSAIPFRYSDTTNELELNWVVSGCKECDGEDDYTPTKSGDYRPRWIKVFIPFAAVLATFAFVACLVHVMKLMELRRATNNSRTSTTTASATTIELPRTTGDPTPEATALTLDGIENISKITSCTELLGTSDDDVSGIGTCSICLEEYQGAIKVRYLFQCGHYFHVECIDEWLLKNTTCPICRISL